MSLLHILLLVVLIVVIVGMLPTWGYAHRWGLGYGPSGIGGVILVIFVILLLMGRL
jgi:hypothetical protein